MSAHCIVSCRMQLQNWGEKPEVELLVPRGQLAVGEALIKTMYNKGADLSKLSQQQQLQLLQLADAYNVLPVSTAICNSISSIPKTSLQWDTAMEVFTLPDSCQQLPSYSKLKQAAGDKVQQVLGDLELVWSEKRAEPVRQQLLQRPFSALKQLIADSRTKVASEDTVFFTIDYWLAKNPSTTQEQKKELAELLRLPHCNPSYLTTLMAAHNSWLFECVSPTDLCTAAAIAAAGPRSDWGKEACSSTLSLMRMNARPSSCITSLTTSIVVDMATLEAMFAGADANDNGYFTGSSAKWQGRELELELHTQRDETDNTVILGCNVEWVSTTSSCNNARGRTCLQGSLVVEGGDREIVHSEEFDHKYAVVSECSGGGYDVSDSLGLGYLPGNWADAEQMLRQENYLQEDGCMHIKVTVTGFK